MILLSETLDRRGAASGSYCSLTAFTLSDGLVSSCTEAEAWLCAAVSWTCLIPASMLTRPLMASTWDDSEALSCCSAFRPDRISPSRAETSGFEDMAGDGGEGTKASVEAAETNWIALLETRQCI